jgi:hypothetical protein
MLQQLPPWPGVRDEVLENRLRYLTRSYKRVRVIPDIFTEGNLREEMVGLLADPKTAPITDAEKRTYSLAAIEWLRKMAVGESIGYDVRPAGRALRLALGVDELASPAIDAVARLSTADSQQALANVALAGNRALPLRLKAADALVQHLQLYGSALGQAQVQTLLEQASKESNPDVQARFQLVEGILRPNAAQTGTRLQLYVPRLPPSQAIKEDLKEEPKEKKEEGKEEKEKKEDAKDK